MLKGQITYYYRNRVFKYDVDAIDTSESFTMYMTSGNYDAIQLMSNSDMSEDPNAMWERGVEVKLTKVNVATNHVLQEVNGKQKKVKAPVNADLFCRLAALIRYAKINCSTQNEEGYTGLQLASGEFQACAEKTYIIKFPMDSERTLARVSLNYGDISAIWLQCDDFLIELRLRNMLSKECFISLKMLGLVV